MTEKEKILKRLLEEKHITFEEMLILNEKEIIYRDTWYPPYVYTPNIWNPVTIQ